MQRSLAPLGVLLGRAALLGRAVPFGRAVLFSRCTLFSAFALSVGCALLLGCAGPKTEAQEVESAPSPAEPDPETGGLGPSGTEPAPETKRRIGKLPKEAISATIRGEHPRIQACYHGARERLPELTGALNLRFIIAENGTVEELTVRPDSTLLDIRMQECVLEVLRRLEFPHPDNGIVVVNYPFQFEVEKTGSK